MLVWRPVMDRRVSIGEVRRGEVTLMDLLTLSALMDMEAATAEQAAKESAKK